MALVPFAEHKLLPENKTQALIIPRAVIVHSAGGEAELYGWWQNDQSRGLESHFWVGRNGRICQYIDTAVRADANGAANGYAISIETQSTVHAGERWDDDQAAALVRLIDWLCDTHRIPRQLMRAPTDSGLGWHVMFGAPGPWTPSRGKVCPGPARILQFQTEIIPAVAASVAPPPPPQEPEDMTPDQERKLNETALIAKALQAELLAPIDDTGKTRADRMAALPATVRRLEEKVDAIAEAIDLLKGS